MYVRIYTSIYIHIILCVSVCVCACVRVCVYVRVCFYTSIHPSIHPPIHLSTSTHIPAGMKASYEGMKAHVMSHLLFSEASHSGNHDIATMSPTPGREVHNVRTHT